MHRWKSLFVVWLVAYPILPIAPLIAGVIAWLVGPPFVTGWDAAGWPEIGPLTPPFVLVAIGVPWALGAALIYLAGSQPAEVHDV